MEECFVRGKTLPEAYHKALKELFEKGDVLSCKDWDTRQKEVSMTFYAEEAMGEPMISMFWIGGPREMQQYKMEILDGILDFEIGHENKWEYTYHARFVNQLPFVIEELRRNPDTRRAIMNIRDFEVDSSNTHPACLQSMQFFIRGGKLHQKVMMRSNDAAEATFMNAFAFIMLQEQIAKTLGIPVGSYTHRANSFHCYEKDFERLEGYIKGMERPVEKQTFVYEGYFKDLMEDCIPEIKEMVEELKERV
jgi:thymidylate synthase